MRFAVWPSEYFPASGVCLLTAMMARSRTETYPAGFLKKLHETGHWQINSDQRDFFLLADSWERRMEMTEPRPLQCGQDLFF